MARLCFFKEMGKTNYAVLSTKVNKKAAKVAKRCSIQEQVDKQDTDTVSVTVAELLLT